MALDIEKYLPYLDGYGWTREDKIEILRYVLRMMETQADKAFGMNSLPLSCGQIRQNSLRNQGNTVNLKDQSLSQFYGEAANDNPHKAMSSKGDRKYAK
jgi:hypothetical protein